jgi:hypothetical protein
VSACKNCGTVLDATFCPRCGQKDVDLERPIFTLVFEVLRETFEVDGRMFRTLALLFGRPGALTREYLEGHRQRFTPPFRLYLVISLLFFFTMSWAAGQGALLEEGQTMAVDAQGQAQLLSDDLPRLMFLLLPVFALMLKVAFWRRLYFDHIICAIHMHSAAYVVLAVMLPLERPSGDHWLPLFIQLAALVYLITYVISALRRVYDIGPGRASSVGLGILVAYMIVMAVVINISRGLDMFALPA